MEELPPAEMVFAYRVVSNSRGDPCTINWEDGRDGICSFSWEDGIGGSEAGICSFGWEDDTSEIRSWHLFNQL